MNHTQRLVLRALYEMASEDQAADLPGLASRIGLSCTRTIELLDALDRQGLVDAERVRLTLIGLTLAVNAPATARVALQASA